jgi:hypothetical protein
LLHKLLLAIRTKADPLLTMETFRVSLLGAFSIPSGVCGMVVDIFTFGFGLPAGGALGATGWGGVCPNDVVAANTDPATTRASAFRMLAPHLHLLRFRDHSARASTRIN